MLFYKYISILICIIGILLIFIIINNFVLSTINEKFDENNIKLLSKEDVTNILINDHDNYYKTFYEIDLKMRNVNSINEYIELIKKTSCDMNEIQKKKIRKCINKANERLKKIKFDWFDGEKAVYIPWKIGCIQDKFYENGLPHTRSDVIIISKKNIDNYDNDKLTNTLIHEKVHIYQKKYKYDVKKYLDENKFKPIKYRDDDDNIRANPDLDNIVYSDSNNNIYKANYLQNCKSIEDVVYSPHNSQSYEHPFEKMAIYIEKYN